MKPPFTPEIPTLDELERLEKAATPGPWMLDIDRSVDVDIVAGRVIVARAFGPEENPQANAEENAALIAAARNVLPTLIAVARAARDVEELRSSTEAKQARSEINDLRKRIARLEKLLEASEDTSAVNEFEHAVGHTLDCEQGTVLCDDCKRLLRGAMKYSKKKRTP